MSSFKSVSILYQYSNLYDRCVYIQTTISCTIWPKLRTENMRGKQPGDTVVCKYAA